MRRVVLLVLAFLPLALLQDKLFVWLGDWLAWLLILMDLLALRWLFAKLK
jgi:hypothetical protein